MKKLVLGVAFSFVTALAFASSIQRLSRLGPALATSNVTIAAGGAKVRNCVNELDLVVDAASTFRILDGGTTTYAIDLSSGAALVRSWDDHSAPCGTANTAMYLNVTGGNFKLNYSGFTY